MIIIRPQLILQHAKNMQSLTQPSLELGLHTISCHSFKALDLFDSIIRGFRLHLLDISLLFVCTSGSVGDITLDLQFICYEFFQRVEIPTTLVILSFRVAVMEIFDCRICDEA